MWTDEQIVQRYLELRAQKETMENKHKLELIPIKDAMNKIEAVVSLMLAQRVTPKDKKPKMKTDVGTAFTKQIFNVKIVDKPEFLKFAYATDMTLLDIRASESGIADYIEKRQQEQSNLLENERVPIIIPGIETDRLNKVIFRTKS